AEYGPSAFDVRHQVVVNYLYELPFGKGRRFMGNANAVVDNILGGWNVAGITNWHSGFPLTILRSTATDFSGFNQFADRANIGTPGTTPLPKFNFDNPLAVFPATRCPANTPGAPCYFTDPFAGNIGNLGRNAFRGPDFTNVDFSLQKNFRVTENKKFQFRADFFNLLNHPNFDLPVGNLSSGAAGTITSLNGNSRLIQLALRFVFFTQQTKLTIQAPALYGRGFFRSRDFHFVLSPTLFSAGEGACGPLSQSALTGNPACGPVEFDLLQRRRVPSALAVSPELPKVTSRRFAVSP